MRLEELEAEIDSSVKWSRAWLEQLQISTVSRFVDEDWYLDNPTHGQGRSSSTIHWALPLGNGSCLLDEHNADLLFWMKSFIISLFVFPQSGVKVFKAGSARILFLGLCSLVRWMVEHSLNRVEQLDRGCVESYIQDLPRILARETEDEDGVGIGTAWRSIRTLLLLWKQSQALVLLGIEPMRDRPWSGVSGKKIAKSIADKADGWIPQLPDEVAAQVLNKAWWFLSGPHKDILKLKSVSDKMYNDLMQQKQSMTVTTLRDARKSVIVGEVLLNFEFSVVSAGAKSWFEWLPSKCVHRQFGRLCRSLVSACLVVLQASTGMRSSEICGLLASAPDECGLPGNVRIESSISGNTEIFILVSDLSKDQSVPRPVEWLLGARVSGDTDYPLPVIALGILYEFYESFSEFNVSKFLLSSWVSPTVPRSEGGLKRFTNKTLVRSIKSFVFSWVPLEGLPDQSEEWVEPNDLVVWKKSRGEIIRSHQFRKTFASFALGVDSKLLPAVQMQFHHVSVAVTESNYWGRFRTQVDSIHSAQQQRTALMLYEMATGDSLAAGRQATVIRAWISDIKELINGKSKAESWSDIRTFLFEKGIVVWFAPHGSCLPLDDSEMQCHRACGTRPLVGRAPNYRGQQPSICLGCQCFIINRSHLDFWRGRHKEYSDFLSSPLAVGNHSFGVIRARADQALKIIKLLTVSEKEELD